MTPIPPNDATFTIWELTVASRGDLTRLPATLAETPVRGVTTDSRAVVPGNAFIALRGETFDGHQYVGAAVERGATAVVIERGRPVPEGSFAVIAVDDVLVAFGGIARTHLRRWRRQRGDQARVAAVTGSAGKTTTKELIAAILSAVGGCFVTTGNLNNRVGVPAVALGLREETYAVFELGMSMPREIAALSRIVEPDVACLLNVGLAHAEGFGGLRSAIGWEKGAVFESLAPDGVAVVNLDDEAARAQLLRTRGRTVGFGTSRGADVRLAQREPEGTRGSRVTVDRHGTQFDVSLPVPGAAAAIDLVAAIAVADAVVGRPVPSAVIAGTVRAWTPPEGRLETFELEGDILVVNDSYNANPASMRAALSTLVDLRRSGRGRGVAVLGEMRELGPISPREHEELGAEIVRSGVELVFGCGGDIDGALRRAHAGGVVVRYAADSARAGVALAAEVRPGDVVLFKGSRGAAVERALEALLARHPRVSPTPPATEG